MQHLKRIIPYLKGIGLLVSIASVYLLIRRQQQDFAGLSILNFVLPDIPLLLLSLLLILLGYLFHTLLLWRLLGIFSGSVRLWDVLHANLKPQVAKYIPGGIFQVTGTAALLLEKLSPRVVIAGLAAQTGLLILLSGMLGGPLYLGSSAPVLSSMLLVPGGFFLAVFLLWLLTKPLGVLPSEVAMGGLLRRTAESLTLGLLFFAAAGGSFYLLLEVFPMNPSFPFGRIAGAFSLSWSAGILIIGSPGGLGVREVVLASLLDFSHTAVPVGYLLFIHRLIWILADLILVVIPFEGLKRLFPVSGLE